MRPDEAPTGPTPLTRNRRVARKLGLARAVVGWERLWPSIWIPVLVLAAFFGTALLGLAEGASFQWDTRDHQRKTLSVLRVEPAADDGPER